MIHGLKTKQQNVIYFYCFTAKIVNAAKSMLQKQTMVYTYAVLIYYTKNMGFGQGAMLSRGFETILSFTRRLCFLLGRQGVLEGSVTSPSCSHQERNHLHCEECGFDAA